MITRILTLTAILIAFALLQHNECAAHGFGGYHNAAIRAAAVNRAATLNRGINIGVNAAPYRRYSYSRYPAPLPIAPYYPAYNPSVPFPDMPGPGPANLDKLVGKPAAPKDSRASSLDSLDAALKQMSLPSDAGLPAAPAK
eukprot:COSAG01_NODE_265_length_19887_cov_33.672579_7_plen_141_part_00